MRDGVHFPIVPKGANAIDVWGQEQIGNPTMNYRLIIKNINNGKKQY